MEAPAAAAGSEGPLVTRKRGPGPPMGFDLRGWGEILPVVGMTEARARAATLRDVDPLPVTPWVGSIIAVRRELEAWAKREEARAVHSPRAPALRSR